MLDFTAQDSENTAKIERCGVSEIERSQLFPFEKEAAVSFFFFLGLDSGFIRPDFDFFCSISKVFPELLRREVFLGSRMALPENKRSLRRKNDPTGNKRLLIQKSCFSFFSSEKLLKLLQTVFVSFCELSELKSAFSA